MEASARARSHGKFLREWESSAALSKTCEDLCKDVETFIQSSNNDSTINLKNDGEDDGGGRKEEEGYSGKDGLKGLGDVDSAEEFYAWHMEMERRLDEASEEGYRGVVEELQEVRREVIWMLSVVEKSLKGVVDVREGKGLVERLMSGFREDCEVVVKERKRLGDMVDVLRQRLKYFEELESLSVRFEGNGVDVTSGEFVKLLHRLDECVAYASSSSGVVADADGYLAKFLDLQKKAFHVIHDHVVGVLKETSAQVAKELKEERAAGAGFMHADLTDASKEYLRFRTIAPKVKSLMTELYSRAKGLSMTNGESPMNGMPKTPSSPVTGRPYGESPLIWATRNTAMSLYADCEECFLDHRKRLLQPSVAAHVNSLAEVRNMIALARLGSSYVLRVCQLERQLYEHFFPRPASDSEAQILDTALKNICDFLYVELRPQILQENDLDKLVYLIEVLKTEILGDEVPRRGQAGAAFAPSAIRAVEDAQERIIYRAEVYLRDEIRSFSPSADDLDYPDKILNVGKNQEGKSVTGKNDMRAVGIYATWYPPVERTLRLLSMLYRCVDGQVFAGVAQEAVAMCVHSVSGASAKIAASGKPHAEEHAQLFLIWQLLMTREQISPFDVEMSYTEHELDFFELRSLLGSVIRGQLSVRSLATPPSIREKVVDSKRELEHRVRSACESFILRTTRLILDPLLGFLAKCNALPSSRRVEREPKAGEIPPSPLKEPFDALKGTKGSFAHPSKVADIWKMCVEALETKFPDVVERMKVYITKSASRAVLLGQVRANIAEAGGELLSVLQTRYTLEERAEIGIDGDAVGKILAVLDEIVGQPKTPRAFSPRRSPKADKVVTGANNVTDVTASSD